MVSRNVSAVGYQHAAALETDISRARAVIAHGRTFSVLLLVA